MTLALDSEGAQVGVKDRTFSFKWESLTNLLVFLVIYVFLLFIFKPSLLLSETVTAGGDMASHYYPAKFLRDELLPRGHVIGWLPGWYGGMPLFQFYFPLPFVAIAVLGYLIPLQIAFKLVTVFGVFSLPVACYMCMKLMNFRFPAPIFAATFSLPFLFMESHSMWGGNIPSTLAGEFSYSISLSLTILFFGTLYRGVRRGRHVIGNASLLAVIALTHVYTVLWVAAATPVFALASRREQMLEKVKYLLKTYPLAFALTGFWILPLLARLSYTTSYDIPWRITEDLLPPILWPFLAFSAVGVVACAFRRNWSAVYHVWSILVAMVFFFLAPKLGVVDIRFLPFVYLSLMLVAAFGLYFVVRNLRGLWVVPLIVVLLTIFWVNSSKVVVTADEDSVSFNFDKAKEKLYTWKYGGYSEYWVKWNYEGFEAKMLWPQFKDANDYMGGTVASPRAKFEHSDTHNAAGTVRAFESIPLFAGRSILEGLYMQSITTSPFTFYVQSEVSQKQSCPFWAVYPCTHFDLEKGTEHLKMFNTQYLVARANKTKEALRDNSQWSLAHSSGVYEVWELTTNPDHYVTVPEYEPVLYVGGDWKNISYQWFRNQELLKIPVVFKDEADGEDMDRFSNIVSEASVDSLSVLESERLDAECEVKEVVGSQQIQFSTTCPGIPHIISVSYYPSWKVEGADRVYLVSPSFMLVYPEDETVTLRYGKTLVDWLGLLLSASAALIILYAKFSKNRKVRDFFSS